MLRRWVLWVMGVSPMPLDLERKRRRDRERIARLRAAARAERQAERAEQQAATDEELARYGGDAMAWLLARMRQQWPMVMARLRQEGERVRPDGPVLPAGGRQEGRRWGALPGGGPGPDAPRDGQVGTVRPTRSLTLAVVPAAGRGWGSSGAATWVASSEEPSAD